MKKTFKILSIIATCLLLVGSILFCIGFGSVGWNFNELSSVKIQQNTFEEKTDNRITTLFIDFENADVSVKFEGETLSVAYPVSYNRKGKPLSKVTLTESNATLSVAEQTFPQAFLWNFTSPKVTVTLPADRTYTLTFVTNNGDITVGAGGKTSALHAETDNGDVKVQRIESAGNLYVETNNGDVSVQGAESAGDIHVETDNGDVTLTESSTQGKLTLKTDNGDIKASGQLTANEIFAETNNGDMLCANAVLQANKITLNTDTGDVNAKIYGAKTDYTITVAYELGNTNLHSSAGGEKILRVETALGDISITVTK